VTEIEHDTSPQALLNAARADYASVLDLTRALVRIPTRGGIDPYQPAISLLTDWFTARGLDVELLNDASGEPVGMVTTVHGARPGPTWVMDACLDTAGFGDEAAWTHPPTAAVLDGDWLHGRGTADSKVAVAILAHLAVRLHACADQLTGDVAFLYDLDEHTGEFGGAKTYFAGTENVAGVMIAYPGIDKLVTGGRGIHRLQLRVHGRSSHSGSRRTSPNAIVKASEIIAAVDQIELPAAPEDSAFPLAPKMTVTAIAGGEGYSITPDLCLLNIDIRTTPAFDGGIADAIVKEILGRVDAAWPTTEPTDVELVKTWPPFALGPTSVLRSAVLAAAEAVGLAPEPLVAGPSNIGNYLSGLGIEATAGFGVSHEQLHATDERILVTTIPAVQAAYHGTILRLTEPSASNET
jgi:succinyl-diaminopimelate desuccinylase